MPISTPKASFFIEGLILFGHNEKMFWRKKDKAAKPQKQKKAETQTDMDVIASALNEVDIGDRYAQGSQSDKIRAEALALTRKARENLGEDTIKKMADMLRKK